MAVAPVLAIAAVASAALSAKAALDSGAAQKKLGDYNAALAVRDAKAATMAAGFEETKQRTQFEAFRGKQIVSIAAGGGSFEGSPLLALADNRANAEIDALAIRHSGSVAEARALSEAASQRFQGSVAKTASYYQAGSALLGGVYKAGSIYAPKAAA